MHISMLGYWRQAERCLQLGGLWRKPAPTRAFTTHPQKFLESEERWRVRDGVSRSWELIYKAPMDNVINPFSTFLTVSSITMAGVGVYYYTTPHDSTAPIMLGDSDIVLANNMNEFMVYVVSFIALHIALRVLISKYCIRMYKKEDKYLAVFRGYLFNQITKHEFHVKEFKKVTAPSIVGWAQSRYALGTRKAILLEDYFKTPRHLMVMLSDKSHGD